VIASVHIADIGKRAALALSSRRSKFAKVPGARYAEITVAAPLGDGLLPKPQLGHVGLIAMWDSDSALDGFLGSHPLAARLAHGWRVRLQPTRIVGAWSPLSGLLEREEAMDDEEPAAVLTIGRLRLSQTVRFLRASAAAEALAVRNPSVLASTGLAKPPALVATFSLWQSVAAMRAYAMGENHPAHLAAIQAHAAKPFHHESAFVRFRPYAAEGSWDGREPLAAGRDLVADGREPLAVDR
jgi:hypothetical protein